MEPTPNQPSQQKPPLSNQIGSPSGSGAPHSELKQSASSLKDSSLSYMQAKAELAAIEAKEAASFAKKKIGIGIITAFFGIFSYALLLLLSYGIILQFAGRILSKISRAIALNESNIIILIMMIFHLFIFLIYLLKLSKKPQEELFSLTKSEFQKDKQWLAEINQTNEK
jgi:uncharacterized membrane protein YqjE